MKVLEKCQLRETVVEKKEQGLDSLGIFKILKHADADGFCFSPFKSCK